MTNIDPISPKLLVAHRGYAGRYPENTIPALHAALDTGVSYIEFDVQLTRDYVPVMFHDADIKRVTGANGSILKLDHSQATNLEAAETFRFGDRYSGTFVVTLDDALKTCGKKPKTTLFVEIKSESIRQFGHDIVKNAVVASLKRARNPVVAISFDRDMIIALRNELGCPIAWVLEKFNDKYKIQADALKPDYLFCNHKKIGRSDELWRGSWRWVMYEIDDLELAHFWLDKGADLLETMWPGELMGRPFDGQADDAEDSE